MDYFTPTEMLADWLRPVEKQLNHELSQGETTEDAGARTMLAARASTHDGYTNDGMLRRLYSIFNNDSYKTDANIADALVIAAGEHFRDTLLPIFPGTHRTALEMVETLNDLQDLGLKPLERQRLARSLNNFTKGFQMGYDRPNRAKRRQMKIDSRLKRAARKALLTEHRERELVMA